MKIKVYLSCCGGDQAINVVKEAVRLSGAEAIIETVSDMAEIATAGIMSTPAIQVNNKIVASGRLPKAQDLATVLVNAAG